MKTKRILFLGGAYAQIPIILEAKRRGWYVITCDYLPENPGHKYADEYHNVSTTDREKVLELARDLHLDYVVAYASDPAAPVAAYVSEQLGLPGNSYDSIRVLSEKDLFRKFLLDNGFNAPRSVSVTANRDPLTLTENLNFPVIVKPTDSSGSKGVSKVISENDLQKAVEYASFFSRNKRIIIEEFVVGSGKQLHGDGFVFDGNLVFTYLGDHHYDTKVNPFVPFSTTWPSERDEKTIQTVEKVVASVVKMSGFKNGGINIEARIAENGDVYIMEIGPRSGGNFVPQVIRYATGFDMVSATLDALNIKQMPSIEYHNGAAAYYVVHSLKDGVLNHVEINDEVKQYVKEYHQYVQPGESVKSFQGANAAIGVILLAFPSVDIMNDCMAAMDKYVKLIISES
jgi:biotin carboxylase